MSRVNQPFDVQELGASSVRASVEAPVVALGYFDGVHLGHREIMREACRIADAQGLTPTVHTFSDMPFTKSARSGGALLTDLTEKSYWLAQYGIKRVFFSPFDTTIKNIEADLFLDMCLAEQLHAKAVVVGEDYRFGRHRLGDVSFLEKWGREHDVLVSVVPPFCLEGTVVSSSQIRNHVAEGRMSTANRMLGYPMSYTGVVEKGFQIGRTLGFPTANIPIPQDKCVPCYGVYASLFGVEGKLYPGVSNVGLRPTMCRNESVPLLETMLLDETLDLYDKDVRVFLLDFMRAESKFSDKGALQDQVQRDISQARRFHVENSIDTSFLLPLVVKY